MMQRGKEEVGKKEGNGTCMVEEDWSGNKSKRPDEIPDKAMIRCYSHFNMNVTNMTA